MGTSSTTTQRNDPYGPSQPYINQGLADAGALYDAGGFRIDPYMGDLVADRDPLSNAAYNASGGVGAGGLNSANMAQGSLARAMDPNVRSQYTDQLVQNTIDRIMPGINSSFAGSGMSGSGLHAQNLASGVSSGVAGVLDNAWQQGENRALQAAGMVPGINNAAYGAVNFLDTMGRGNQQQNQAEINAAVLQDQQAQTADLNAIQDYLALTSGVGGMFGVQSSRTSGGNGLLSALGFGMQAAPFLFPSDRRLKENIKRVGKTDDGLNVYTYNYKGNPLRHMGVMAQEVEKVKPGAVGEIGGFKAVDYGAL